MTHYVYMILCENGSFYTGYTRNLESRLRLHSSGRGARYTRMHKPRKLVHVEEYSSASEAMKREKQMKRLNHTQKLELVKLKKMRKRKRS